MKQEFNFFRTTMPESRKADFHLGCFNGSVFLDFMYTTEKRIKLIRISFDGYGCCELENSAKCINDQLSKNFRIEIQKDNLDQERLINIVSELIRLNKDNIWKDALDDYNLLQL
jgi:hypothetical protein